MTVRGVDDFAVTHAREGDNNHVDGIQQADPGPAEHSVAYDRNRSYGEEKTTSEDESFARGHDRRCISLPPAVAAFRLLLPEPKTKVTTTDTSAAQKTISIPSCAALVFSKCFFA